MSTVQAQIQVGPSHQARLPPLQDSPVEFCESNEDLVWKPDSISDVDLLMYLRASRSMAAFVGWCDGGSTDDGCAAASMDETTICSLQLLHENAYNTGKALQALVKVINPKSVDRRWSEEDAKRFVRGLKQHGKNFFKIRRDLPGKTTAELVEYYYLWKKLSLTARPPTHRRRRVLRRQPPTPPTPPSSESVEEPTSPSDDASDNEMESDEAAEYECSRCHATQSTTWFEVKSQPGTVLCASCKSFRHASDTGELPPYVFRPVKEKSVQPLGSDRQLDSASSGENGSPDTENSEDCCAAGDRATPSTGSSCSSRAGLLETDKAKEPATSKCSSPGKTDLASSMQTNDVADTARTAVFKSEDNFDKKDIAHSQIISERKLADDRKVNEFDQTSSTINSDYCTMQSVVKKEIMESYDLNDPDLISMSSQFKAESVQDAATAARTHSPHADLKIPRAVASVAPCSPFEPGVSSPWKHSSLGSLPPPPALLRQSSPHPVPSYPSDYQSSAVLENPHVADRTSQMFEDRSEESDMESGARSPSPEPRPVNEKFCASKNAIFVRRWFRGNNTCSRCDFEYQPPPNSEMASKRDMIAKSRQQQQQQPTLKQTSSNSSSNNNVVPSGSSKDSMRRDEEYRKKNRSPPENHSFDARITSTLMSMQGGMDMPPGVPRGPMYQPFGAVPTPALQKLSEYIRPHASGAAAEVQRYMPYGPPGPPMPGHPPPGVDPYLRFPGPPPACLPPPGWEGADKREREAVFEREMRELEMIDKMRHEMAAQGFDRLLAMGANPLDVTAWEEIQRLNQLGNLGALPPGFGGYMPGVFQQDLMQRERERIELIRSSQEQQQLAAAFAANSARDPAVAAAMAASNGRDNAAAIAAAAMAAANGRESAAAVAAAMAAANSRDNAAVAAAMAAAGSRENAAAVFQLMQKFAQDPVMLQRHLLSLSKDQELARMMDASSLIYHFARADPLAGAAPASGTASGTPVVPPNLPPAPPPPQHFPAAQQQQELMALAQYYERTYLDLLSRPPYNSDPALAQQLMMHMSQQHDVLRHQIAMERERMSPQPPPPSMR